MKLTIGAILGIGVVLLLIGLLLSAIILSISYCTYSENVEFTVKNKEAVANSNDSNYLVFTEKEVFTVDDQFVFWRWDSSDEYNKIVAGKTYKAEAVGFRFHFFSWYRNLYNITEIKEKTNDK